MAQQKNSLTEALKEVHLEENYWLDELNTICGITEYGQLKFIDIDSFESLANKVRYAWETNALKALIGIDTYENLNKKRKQETINQEEKMAKILEDLKTMKDEGQMNIDKLSKRSEEELREALYIKANDWIKTRKHLALDDVINKLKSQLGDVNEVVPNRHELSTSKLLASASGGLALKGILIKNDKLCGEVRKTILNVPQDIELKAPISRQRDDVVEFTSRLEADRFQKSVDTLGHSLATNVKGGYLTVEAGSGFTYKSRNEENKESETHSSEVYLFREMYSYMPTAVCDLNPLTLKLCENVLVELRKIEQLMEGTENQEIIQQRCTDFFTEYGSHVNVGGIEFGGLHEWIATYSSNSNTNKEEVKDMVTTALNSFVSMSSTCPTIAAAGSVDGNQVKDHASMTGSYNASELAKMSMHIRKKGGPQEVRYLLLWKKGLMKYNSTWAIIDRGDNFERDFMGIWQLIPNHTNELTNVADALQKAWLQMNSMLSGFPQESDKIVAAIESMSDMCECVNNWILDEILPDNVIEYLQKLLNHLERTCSDTRSNKYWTDALINKQPFARFFMHIAEIEKKYSPEHVPYIQYLLRKLIALADDQYFPNKNKIMEWIQVSPTEEYVPAILRHGPIKDIPTLLHAVKQTLLPVIHIGYAKALLEEKTRDGIDIQATMDMALAVDHLIKQLDSSGKQHELFLLLAILRILTFDKKRQTFDVLLTEQSLIAFIDNCEEVWKEFQTYSSAESMKLQAFLIHFVITSMPSSQDPYCREQEFLESLKVIQDLLTPEMNHLLEQFRKNTPYNWNKLVTNLVGLRNGNQQVLQCKAVGITDLEEITNPTDVKILETDNNVSDSRVYKEDSDVGKLLLQLGLTEYYPSKITVQDVMTVGTLDPTDDFQLSMLPWLILHKLIMLDYNGCESFLSKVFPKPTRQTTENPGEDEEDADILSVFDKSAGSEPLTLNLLDVFITIYSCCDLILRQTLLQKMFLCRFAVPFILPQLAGDSLTYSLWALRSIVVEWRKQGQNTRAASVVSQPTKIVSFIRIGKPTCAKSILLNNVLSDQTQQTFLNRDCPQGHSIRSLANGIVEAQWYLPAEKANDTFEDVTMFLNLRGDACQHPTQVQLLQKMSNVIICCVNIADLGNSETLDTMKSLHGSSSEIIFLLVTKEPVSLTQAEVKTKLEQYIGKSNMTNTIQVSAFRGTREKGTDDLKHELREIVRRLLHKEDGMSVEDASGIANEMGIGIDEFDESCQYAKKLAKDVMQSVAGKSTNECKREMLPLQGDNWKRWSSLLKKKQRAGGKQSKSNMIDEISTIQQEMSSLRQNQLQDCNNLSPLIKAFLKHLIEVIYSPSSALYLEWLKLCLDEKSRETIPEMHADYHQKWLQLQQVRCNGNNTERIGKNLEVAEQQLVEASLGLEHLLREVAQIYEATTESNSELKKSTKESVEKLPNVAAQLLLKGQPMEIMDGDASNIPLTWVKDVFSSIIKEVGDKKVFVISVLGVKSSGKSTVLNTMFGLKFASSTIRCTRGVYMQLLEVDKKQSTIPYDYVLLIDTEGLRAPELGQLKHSYDNELATLVIGLGDVTIMNVKGENVAEMADVLQIAVHAFLRMKITNGNSQLHRTCIFIHQNVPAITAKEKMQHGCQKLQEKLDEMTVEACTIENIANIHTFNQVIDFDGQKHVWYFSDLWHGDPPMAPVNPGYTEKVQDVKECLIKDLPRQQQTFLTFSDMILRIQDLWTGVLSDDFVFSFRNSLAAKAYNDLESKYYELTWGIERGINQWVTQKAIGKLECCKTSNDLEQCSIQIINDLEIEGSKQYETANKEMENFFETSSLKEILIEWKFKKLESLNSEACTYRDKAKQQILLNKDILRVALLHNDTQGKYAVEIMNKAKELADSLKGQDADDRVLHSKFDGLWIQWRTELASRITNQTVEVEDRVEQLLWKRLQKDAPALRNELQQNPLSKLLSIHCLEGSIRADDILLDHHLSFVETVRGKVMSWINKEKQWLQVRQSALQAIDIILRKIDANLKDICKQDSSFQESFATDVIQSVLDGVQEHNLQSKEQYSFTLLPNLMVKLAVHTCRYAVVVFKKMQADYGQSHSVANKLDKYKNTTWNLFKYTVHQSTQEVTAADSLCDQLQEKVTKVVKRTLPGEIMKDILHHFQNRKHNMILAILDNLAEKENFESYRSFLEDAKKHACKWITSSAKKQLFGTSEGSQSQYAKYAENHIRKFIKIICKSIRTSTESVNSQAHSSVTDWGKNFISNLNKLSISEDDLKHVMQMYVADFSNLERLLLERLPDLEKRILNSFTTETADSITWEGETPYQQIVDKLWGCEAACPFCGEPCQRTDPNHASENVSHQCIQHRPTGLKGQKKNDKLIIESCNYYVQSAGAIFYCSDCGNQCQKSNKCSTKRGDISMHLYTNYKTYLPDWDIKGSTHKDSSDYWIWFMNTYQHQLKDMYNAKLPDIPKHWKQISKQQAIKSLHSFSD